MTDEEIEILLRSENPLVVIEAPAGCGKTYQAASYAADIAADLTHGKVLVLTHTHAACSVIAERTQTNNTKVDIRTLDGLINQVATAYRTSMELPEDISAWARNNGYEMLARRVRDLLRANPMICHHLAKLFPVIICDEHQDANEYQDEIVLLLKIQGAEVRVFGDPVQIIPGGRGQNDIALATTHRWENIKDSSVFGALEIPHRWSNTSPELGEWVQGSRQRLREGSPIDLSGVLPNSIHILFAENGSIVPGSYRLVPENWPSLNRCVNENCRMLLLASSNKTIQSLRGTFRPRFPIWEGHTRNQLELFVDALSVPETSLNVKARAFIAFLKGVLVGFTGARYDGRLLQEIRSPTENPTGQIPPRLKEMAQIIRRNPNHVGFANAANYLKNLIEENVAGFSDIKIDFPRELNDLIKLRSFADPVLGFAEISHRRSRAHPKPPYRALSTIHKSKGLEAESVVLFACDGAHFPDTLVKRNLLYVALSRATQKITFVVSRNDPSPLFVF